MADKFASVPPSLTPAQRVAIVEALAQAVAAELRQQLTVTDPATKKATSADPVESADAPGRASA